MTAFAEACAAISAAGVAVWDPMFQEAERQNREVTSSCSGMATLVLITGLSRTVEQPWFHA